MSSSASWLRQSKGIHLFDRYHSVDLNAVDTSKKRSIYAPSLNGPSDLIPVISSPEPCKSTAFSDRILCGVLHILPPAERLATAESRRSYMMDFKPVLETAGCRKLWDPMFGDAEPVAALSNRSGLAYSHMKGVWPVSPRDMSVVLTSAVGQDLNDDGRLLSFATSIVDDNAVPPQTGHVRSFVNIAMFHLELVDLQEQSMRDRYLQHIPDCPADALKFLRIIYMVHVSHRTFKCSSI